jgi:hypothetical protein
MSEPTSHTKNRSLDDEQPIEGGEVFDFVDLHFHAAKHRAHTARWLAYLFVALLAISIGIHYIATTILEIYGMSAAAERLGAIYNSWLPVVSSLVSAAATYYFTKEDR